MITDHVFDVITQYTGRQWKMDGELVHPSFDNVRELLIAMIDELRTSDYDSIESGGILLKKDGDKIDVYVHLGELDETESI